MGLAIGLALQGTLTDPALEAVLGGPSDSSVDWTVRLWARSGDFWPVRDKLTERLTSSPA
jgi:small-conductance mechanosensitive channel